MINPADSTKNNGLDAGINSGNPINDPSVNNGQGYNTFDLSKYNCITCRFGEVTPFFVQTAEPKDRPTLRTPHELRSFTLAAPIMFPIRATKAFFSVPYSSLYPFNWDALVRQPNQGDDVPADAYNFIAGNNISAFQYLLNGQILSYTPGNPAFTKNLFYALILNSDLFSRGSLIDCLGLRSQISVGAHIKSFDVLLNQFVSDILVKIRPEGDSNFVLATDSQGINFTVKDPSSLADWRKVFYDLSLSFTEGIEFNDIFNGVGNYQELVKEIGDFWKPFSFANLSEQKPINIDKLVAYQQVIAQFYSNDRIDHIYSADTWMKNQFSLATSALGSDVPWPTFEYNGYVRMYDVYSSHVLNLLLEKVGEGFSGNTAMDDSLFGFFHNTFGFGRSLKYGDYFTTGRKRPLAVGDVDIPVVGEKVSAVDVTKNIVFQRFLNAVNRVGAMLKEYGQSIYGVAPANLPPEPHFLASNICYVNGQDVENTSSEDQGRIVSNLYAKDERFAYDAFIQDRSIILGLISFDVPVCYSNTTSRHDFATDRLDWFQPWLQNIGDQEIYGQELHGSLVDSTQWAYTLRDGHYKMSYNEVHGGFYEFLPAWMYIADNDGKLPPNFICSDYIRHKPSDFDRFYSSLTGFSPASYFHFIMVFRNVDVENRAMAYKPTIL